MTKKPLEICILAAGIGSRMKTTRPKAMQLLAGRPLLAHILDTSAALSPAAIHVVVGPEADEMKAAFAHLDINWVTQHERNGTGHAVMQVLPHLMDNSDVLMLVGDAPLITRKTLAMLLALDADLGVLSVDLDNPFGYGRIIREDGQVTAIIEERDASDAQRRICEINTGIMKASSSHLQDWLPSLSSDNDQGEYLLTDIIGIAVAGGAAVSASKAQDPLEVTGVNTFEQLAGLERDHQLAAAQALMAAGVQIVDPARFDLRGKLSVGSDVRIDINVIIEGDVEIGDGTVIGPNCVISNSRIGPGCEIKANTVIDGAVLASGCSAGPFARLRPGTDLDDDVAIGNFVEVKKSRLGKGTKASHLAYLGDSTLGAAVNIGAGTITCNYDGVNKWETHIGDGVFVGSNSSLVAPVTLGAGSTTGAGSTITKNVEPGVLAIGRGRQTGIANWQRPVKKEK